MGTCVPFTSTVNVVCHRPTIDGLTADPLAVPSAGAWYGDGDNRPDTAAAAAAGKSESPHDARAVALTPTIRIAVQRPNLPIALALMCVLLRTLSDLASKDQPHPH